MLSRLRRFAFRLLYNELAFTYGLVSRMVSFGRWRCWQHSALRYLPPPAEGLVLEVAHGTGDLQVELRRRGYQTVAFDLSPYMGRLAQRNLRRLDIRADIVRADATRLPYRSNAIASVVCTFPTPFIFSQQVLYELARIVQPSGQVVVVLAGQLQGEGFGRSLIRQLYRLTGQSDTFLSESAVVELFRSTPFAVESHLADCRGSTAQLAVLTNAPGEDQPAAEVSLDSVSSS